MDEGGEWFAVDRFIVHTAKLGGKHERAVAEGDSVPGPWSTKRQLEFVFTCDVMLIGLD